jgi:hypothetical protein
VVFFLHYSISVNIFTYSVFQQYTLFAYLGVKKLNWVK